MSPVLADLCNCLLWWDILESVWWANYLSGFLRTCRDEKDRDISLYKSYRQCIIRSLEATLFLPSAVEDSVSESADCFRPTRDLLGIPESQVPEFRGWSKESKELNWLHRKEKLGLSALFPPLPPLKTLRICSIHSVNFAVLRRNDSAVTVTVGASRCAQGTPGFPTVYLFSVKEAGPCRGKGDPLTLQNLLQHADSNRHLVREKRCGDAHRLWDYYGNNHPDTGLGKTHPWELTIFDSKPGCGVSEQAFPASHLQVYLSYALWWPPCGSGYITR